MGFTQAEGIDYTEVFAPTTRLETLQLALSLLGSCWWIGRQVDIKTAFLKGRLDAPVYMTQPQAYEDPDHPDWVCGVTRSIYGLKHSPRRWNSELHTALVSFGLIQSLHNPTLYFCLPQCKSVDLLTVHVENIAVIGIKSFVVSVIVSISCCFDISSNEPLHHFLSLNIKRDIKERKDFVFQQHYIHEIGSGFLPDGHTSVKPPTLANFKDLLPRAPSEQVSPVTTPVSLVLFSGLANARAQMSLCSQLAVAIPT